MQSFISNLKQQSVISILLTTIVSNTLYSFWYQIPWVAKTIYGDMPVSTQPMFGLTVGTYINMLVAVVGLSLLISKKGVLHGFTVGAIVAICFTINSFIYSFVTYPLPGTGTPYALATSLGLILFYAIPGALLGYFRKD